MMMANIMNKVPLTHGINAVVGKEKSCALRTKKPIAVSELDAICHTWGGAIKALPSVRNLPSGPRPQTFMMMTDDNNNAVPIDSSDVSTSRG
jgi:hypothetical protein